MQRFRRTGLSDQIVLPFLAKSWQVLKRSYSLARHSSRKLCLSCDVSYSISFLFLFSDQLFLLVGKKPTLQMEWDTISSECRWEHLVIASSRNFTFFYIRSLSLQCFWDENNQYNTEVVVPYVLRFPLNIRKFCIYDSRQFPLSGRKSGFEKQNFT